MNHRRTLLAAAASFALAKTGAAWAQTPAPNQTQTKGAPILIGWLATGSRAATGRNLTVFKEGMAALGWKEGAQYILEERWADADYERLRPMAEELAAKQPALIVAAPSQAVAAAVKAAPRTPIVHANGADPVAAGFAASLARPGGMVTGVTNMVTDINAKNTQLLLEAVPGVKRIGFLTDARNVNRSLLMQAAEHSVAQLKVEARFAEVGRAEDIEPALARLAKEGAQALVIFPSPLLGNERENIIRLALARRWATIGTTREFAESGALLSYGANPAILFRRAAYYVDRILKGAKPGDLPMEQPMTIELVINGKTAKALGIKLPQSLLIRAERVIE